MTKVERRSRKHVSETRTKAQSKAPSSLTSRTTPSLSYQDKFVVVPGSSRLMRFQSASGKSTRVAMPPAAVTYILALQRNGDYQQDTAKRKPHEIASAKLRRAAALASQLQRELALT